MVARTRVCAHVRLRRYMKDGHIARVARSCCSGVEAAGGLRSWERVKERLTLAVMRQLQMKPRQASMLPRLQMPQLKRHGKGGK